MAKSINLGSGGWAKGEGPVWLMLSPGRAAAMLAGERQAGQDKPAPYPNSCSFNQVCLQQLRARAWTHSHRSGSNNARLTGLLG